MTSTTSRTLSKSDFTLALTCDTKLYFREHRFPDAAGSPYVQLLRYGGFMVDALARAQRPDGILLESTWNHADDYARTRELLARETVTLFQPTFLVGRRVARADILEKRGNVVRLIEVKAKSFNGAEHAASIAAGKSGAFRLVKTRAHRPDWLAKFQDLTFQVLALEHVLPGVTIQPVLLLIDKSKQSQLDGAPRFFELLRRTHAEGDSTTYAATFTGTRDQLAQLDVLTEVDATADVADLRASVEAEAARFEGMLDAPFDRATVTYGTKCDDCQFHATTGPVERNGFAMCWGEMAAVRPHILDLFSVGSIVGEDGVPLVETLPKAGKASLFDIPESRIVKRDGTVGPQAERQRRQVSCTRSGEMWVGPQLRSRLESLSYPLHFIDFEASRLALPYHARMRPYGQVAFQWSCHTVDAPDTAPRHTEWLNAADEWPNLTFVQQLRAVIGDDARVITWSSYEEAQLKEIAREHERFSGRDEALVAWVDRVVGARVFDLHDCAKEQFYHPGMGGRTSIKVVLDALWRSDAAMREQFAAWTGRTVRADDDPYEALPALVIDGEEQDVREGTGAVSAYEAMMYGVEKDDNDAKAKWRQLLLQYCELDTLSMVLIFDYWRRLTGIASR